MKRMKKYIIIIFASLFLVDNMSANKIKDVKTLSATYTYRGPDNVSMADAKRIAIERAKIQALADEYGTALSQTNSSNTSNANGHSNVNFHSVGLSEVKGIWLEDIDDPVFTLTTYEQDMVVVSVKVKGKTCAVKHSDIDLKISLLRNGTDRKFQSLDYVHGDQLRILFQTPVDGYLAVYQQDEEGNVFCLLPYPEQNGIAYKVAANKEYLLFDPEADCAGADGAYVMEYEMLANRELESNEIYVLFSPNQFSKAADNFRDKILPRELSIDNFQKWMARCRLNDEQMQLSRFSITIKKSE